jgi:hypothetical protein
MFQTGLGFTMKVVPGNSKLRAFQESGNAMKMALDGFAPCN